MKKEISLVSERHEHLTIRYKTPPGCFFEGLPKLRRNVRIPDSGGSFKTHRREC